MKITMDNLKILVAIGRHPDHSVGKLAEEIGWEKRKISSHLNRFRKHGFVLKAEGEDREEGLEWELTGKGHKKVMEKIEELESALDTFVMKPFLFNYKPPHARGSSSSKFVGGAIADILNKYEISETEGENIFKAVSYLNGALARNDVPTEEKEELLTSLLEKIEGVEN